jgi:hypothetical protein
MSRNPKYCEVVVDTPRVQDLRKQQQRQRELREQRERQREQRERELALQEERERQRVAREIERLQGQLGALVNDLDHASLQPLHRHLDAEAFTEIKEEATALGVTLPGGGGRAADIAGRELRRLQRRWSAIQAVAEAMSERLAPQDARRAGEAHYRSRRAELFRLRDAIPGDARRKIASMDGAVRKAMNDADRMLRDGMRGEAVKEIDRAYALELDLQEHLATRGTRGEMIRGLVAELDALKASRDVVSWCSTEIKDLTTTLGALAAEVSHDPREDTAAIEQLRKRFDTIPEIASTRKLRHDAARLPGPPSARSSNLDSSCRSAARSVSMATG